MVIRRRSKASAEAPAPARVDGAAVSAARVVPASAPASSPASDDDVAARAYAKWQARGCPAGDDLHDWYEAERELRA